MLQSPEMTTLTSEKGFAWEESGKYTDILYHKLGAIAKITINRPANSQRVPPAHRR